MRNAIACVDDEELFGTALARALRGLGWSAEWFGSAADALLVARDRYVCILLDWVWPEQTGAGLCRAFRVRAPDTGIIVLTGCETPSEMLSAFQSGADDFVSKMRGVAEIDARLRNVVWRRQRSPAEPSAPCAESVRVDLLKQCVHVGAEIVDLSPAETRALALLVAHQTRHASGPSEPVSKTEMIGAVFSTRPADPGNSLRVLVFRLRQKLRDHGLTVEQTPHGYFLRGQMLKRQSDVASGT